MSTLPESPTGTEASLLPPALPESSGPMTDAGPEEQLPEYEPLTPELVEDEAVRGDFVIRWATVLLALLFGWTQIDDTSLLVRIRDGQQRLLPYGVDTFSASAGDRSWVNMAWLSNPLLAGVYGVLGAFGLTLLGAIVSALTFWFLSRTCVKGVSTWWGSVCAALALVAVFPQLVPGPTGCTLLGVSLVVFLLNRWSEDRNAEFVWQIPATIWVWSQLDSRAWIGAAIVLLYTLSWVGLRGYEEGDGPDKAKHLGKITGASLLAWLLHPLHYHVLLSPLTAYQTEYAELRAYKVFDWPYAWQWFPIYSPEFKTHMDLFAIVALGLCGLALLTLAMNFKRLTWEWVLPWVGLMALAVFCAHQLPVAALFSCALITINAQLWYRATCSQKYTVDSLPLAWNRGGRALTVVSLLLLGLVASNGMLMGRDGRRIGAGFSPQMRASITGAEKLAGEVASKEVFNFRLEQGDLLIWAGLKPYSDRRLSLFATGGDNLLERHRNLRQALLLPNSKYILRGKPAVWKAEFDTLHINQAIPRLSGPSPDYVTLIEMLNQGWSMSSLQSFGAVLSRPDSPDEAFQKYRLAHPDVNFIQQQFQAAAPKALLTDGPWIFPRRPTVYDTYLWQPQTTLNEPLQLASHEQALVQLLSSTNSESPEILLTTSALAMSAFRNARQGIILDPQSAPGYRMLALSANYLQRIEAIVVSSFGRQYQGVFWQTQAIHAFHHSLELNPHQPEVHEELAALQMQLAKPDLALGHMIQIFRITGAYTTLAPTDPRYAQAVKNNLAQVTQLKRHVKQVEEAVLKAPATGGTWETALQAAMQGQCSGIALRVLEENRPQVAKNPQYQLLRIGLLSDVGRTEDALRQAESLERMLAPTDALAPQVRQVYALACLAIGDNAQFEKLLRQESRLVAESAVRNILDQAPLVSAPGIQLDLLPASQGYIAYHALYQSPERWANHEYMLAQSEMSTWHNDEAKARLTAILEAEPNVSLRPLMTFYLGMLTGQSQQPISPEMQAAMDRAAAAAGVGSPKPATDSPPTTPTADAPVQPAKNPSPRNPPEPARPPQPPEATPTEPATLPAEPESEPAQTSQPQ